MILLPLLETVPWFESAITAVKTDSSSPSASVSLPNTSITTGESSVVVATSALATGTDAECARFDDSRNAAKPYDTLLRKNATAGILKPVNDSATSDPEYFIAKYS